MGEPKRLRHTVVDFLNAGAPREVEVAFTRNRVTMLSVVFPPDGAIRLRMHEAYLKASDEVLSALRTYLRTRRKAAWETAAAYGRAIRAPVKTPAPVRLRTQGKAYDLDAIMKQVNQTYFGGKVRCRITWGRRGRPQRKGRRQCILYGTYNREQNLVRIHPALDRAEVPAEFVEYIVFHEMLHALIPSRNDGERMQHHGPFFRRMEKTFPNWDRMQRLSRKLLTLLD